MLGYYINDIAERLAARQEDQGWEVRLLIIFQEDAFNVG
jgi:hypothetical protein